jgi:ligand-binding sensor domain-containing protein
MSDGIVAYSNKARFMILRFKFLILFILFYSLTQAQNIAIGQWRAHLPFNKGIALAESGSRIYCATQSGGLFFYDKADEHMESMTKVSGLSDNKVVALKSNKNNIVVIAYDNANIDILKDNTIINIADIKRKSILGKKAVHSIYFYGDDCYLSCGFGIVVLDMVKLEIKDKYIIGQNGASIEVFDFCDDGTFFYAATEKGVFKARIDNPGLANYSEWSPETGLPASAFNFIKAYNNKIYANNLADGNLYFRNVGSWAVFDYSLTNNVKHIEVVNNKLIISEKNFARIYGGNGMPEDLLDKRGKDWIIPNDAILDAGGIVWIAEQYNGLIKSRDANSYEILHPNGPKTNAVYALTAGPNDLWATPGGKTPSGSNQNNYDGLFHFDNSYWSTVDRDNTAALQGVFDIVSITIDPMDEKHLLISAFNAGFIDMHIGGSFVRYTEANSTLQLAGNFAGYCRVMGAAYDSQNNIWVSNSEAAQPLSVKLTDNTWRSFSMGIDTKSARLGGILVDKNDNKWMLIANGLLAFNDNKTIDNTSDDKTAFINNQPGHGNLSSAGVNCFALDDDGAIWIGTDKGVSVLYNPAEVFNGRLDARPVYIQQDGHTQYLLETESVSAIAIDGANRKWFGTKNSGAFLMSADGTKSLAHFDINNSPILSNSILSIAVNPKSGEVFFGTDAGIISYKGTATQGEETYTGVYAYPNPVREDYHGLIAVKGLVKNANVKITDVNGNIVFETKALGGQVVWDGKNFQGIRAQSGVYMVLCTNEDGSQIHVAKILFMN